MFLDFFRMRRQAPTTKPPKGYYDLRVSKATGALVLVDEEGTETVVGSSLSALTVTGAVTVGGSAGTALVDDGGLMTVREAADLDAYAPFQAAQVYADEFIPGTGKVAVVTEYANEGAANTAEAANVVYYNTATGKFQITTA